MLKHLKKKRILVFLLLIIVISIFTIPKKTEKITIIEVEEGKPTTEKELVYFDVNSQEQTQKIDAQIKQQLQQKKEQEEIQEECPEIKPQPKSTQPQIVETENLSDEPTNLDALGTAVEIKLTGILYDRQEPMAIIEIDGNDYLVKTGDKIGDFCILGITQNRIFFKDSIKNYTLVIGEVLYACIIQEGLIC